MADVHVPKIASRPVAGDDGKTLVYDADADAHVYVPLPEGGGGGEGGASSFSELSGDPGDNAALAAALASKAGSDSIPTWGNISGKPAVVAAGATEDAARDAIGLGDAATRNVGTASDQVKPGDWTPAAGEIPDLPASKTTSGVFADARIPNLAASKITGGTFDVARLPVGTTAGTVKAGDWLPGVSEDEDNQATLGSDDLVFVPEPNLAGLPYLASSWLPGIEDQPSGYSPAVWYDEIEDEWPARPTARTDVFIRWCSVGDQGTPPGALARDFVEVYEESAPVFPGSVLASYTFESDTPDAAISPSSPWSQSGGGSTPFTASTAAAIHGSLGGRISAATQNRMLEHTSGSTHTNTRVVDLYIIPRAVAANSVFAAIRDLGASTTRGDIRINTDRTVTIRNGAAATATSTTVLALDATYRIAWKTTTSEGQSARIYNATGDLIETISGALSNNTHDNIRCGLIVASSGYSADYDSIRIGDDWLAPHA